MSTIWPFRTNRGSNVVKITSNTSEQTLIQDYVKNLSEPVFADIYMMILANTSSTACAVDIRDTPGGTIIATIMVPANDTKFFEIDKESALTQTVAAQKWTATCRISIASMEITSLFRKNS